MIGKFFILAFACVFLAQAEKIDLESAVKSALDRLSNINAEAQKLTDFTIKDVESKKTLLQKKAAMFLEKESAMEAQKTKNLKRMAEVFENKAKESNKPPATLECIEKAKANAIAKIEALGPKFEVDIRRMEKTKINNMEISAKNLQSLKESLTGRYETAIGEIKSSKSVVSVRKNLEKATRDYNLLFAELKRVSNQVNAYLEQFTKDASLLLSNFSRDASRTESDGVREIRSCVFRRSFLEEQ